jgi:hypothetical protein
MRSATSAILPCLELHDYVLDVVEGRMLLDHKVRL